MTDDQVREMLDTIGIASIEELFAPIAEKLRTQGNLRIPKGISELELLRDVGSLAGRNHPVGELVSFLGGGAYDHFIPTVVDAMSGQSELLTAYTPYQAEASQGVLQLFYEFQTMVCQLTGMDVANASLYDGASAVAEATLMALRIRGRKRVVVAQTTHPDTLAVLRTYLAQQDAQLHTIPVGHDGCIEGQALESVLDDDTAAVVVQSPNFFGCIERVDRLIPLIHEHGALAIISADPIASGLLKPPGAFDADIVVGEGQTLGIPLQYGGPYLGLMATKEKYLRKMPGRVVGMTKDLDGRRAFCLALQTREQHIKRERATSNICTNQGLLAIRASIYLATMGKCGIASVASQCFDKAHYAAARIAKLRGYTLRFDAPFFKEFVVKTTRGVDRVLASCRDAGMLGGVALAPFDMELDDCFLVAVTEKRTRQEIDALVGVLSAV